MKAGALNVTLINYRNTDALDGVLGAARNTLLCPRCVPGFLEILDSLRVSDSVETMVERGPFGPSTELPKWPGISGCH